MKRRLHDGPCLAIDFDGELIEVELRREPANEIGSSMLEALELVADLCRSGRVDSSPIRALVTFSSVRRGFCAGADLKELHRENAAALSAGDSDEVRVARVRRFLDRIHAVMSAIDEAPFPTVACVHGVTFGGGLELMLTHDVVVAERSARFAFPELRLGLIPGFGGIPRLRRDVGNAVVRDLLLTGRSLGAERAHTVGLVAQLAADGRGREVAQRTAQQMARFDLRTVGVAKRFTKSFPKRELEEEKSLFCELFCSPTVSTALARFDRATDAMPYLPPRERRTDDGPPEGSESAGGAAPEEVCP